MYDNSPRQNKWDILVYCKRLFLADTSFSRISNFQFISRVSVFASSIQTCTDVSVNKYLSEILNSWACHFHKINVTIKPHEKSFFFIVTQWPPQQFLVNNNWRVTTNQQNPRGGGAFWPESDLWVQMFFSSISIDCLELSSTQTLLPEVTSAPWLSDYLKRNS